MCVLYQVHTVQYAAKQEQYALREFVQKREAKFMAVTFPLHAPCLQNVNMYCAGSFC
jgi:hypothetical protein